MKKAFSLLTILGLTLLTVRICGAEEMISAGKKVKFDYTLTVKDQVVDTSEGKQPLEYTQGQNQIIPGLEKQMAGLKVGDERTFNVPAAEAYGAADPKYIMEVAKSNLAPDFKAEVGTMVQMQTQEGQVVPGVIKEVKDTAVVVDFNHPLAGQDLTFKIKIIDIK